MKKRPTPRRPKTTTRSPLQSVTVRVPGSTSNLGAGFDTLGMAVTLYNDVTLRRTRETGVHAATPDAIAGVDMASEAAAWFFARAGVEEFGFSFAVRGDVPMSRGLGSSVTLRAGIVAGLNELSGAGLDKDDLAELVTKLEGHPDNATPAVLGGFCVGRTDPNRGVLTGVVRRAIGKELVFVVVSPSQELETKKARGILPKEIPYFDAVRSINSASYVVAAFISGEYDRLTHAVADFMHEPYRLPLIPGARDAIQAGVAAGALTGWLSGSGSSVMCVTRPAKAARVARAMVAAFADANVPSRVFRLHADNEGLRIIARG
ncbi:MAG TPA: homoserine kinase [Acidobacteriota bacterium]|nr:homoserine kinase [Acidobacteriota bacterium]